MELSTAIRLIEKGISNSKSVQAWADFGAGAGLFTRALANCLSSQSTVYAIDQDAIALSKLDITSLNVQVKKIHRDFVTDEIDIESLDGIILANALHFVKDKPVFMMQLKRMLKPSGKIIIIEYEMTQAKTWVPYPINLKSLKDLADKIGLSLLKMDEEPSIFNNTTMYSALLMIK